MCTPPPQDFISASLKERFRKAKRKVDNQEAKDQQSHSFVRFLVTRKITLFSTFTCSIFCMQKKKKRSAFHFILLSKRKLMSMLLTEKLRILIWRLPTSPFIMLFAVYYWNQTDIYPHVNVTLKTDKFEHSPNAYTVIKGLSPYSWRWTGEVSNFWHIFQSSKSSLTGRSGTWQC